jgi:ferredoxin
METKSLRLVYFSPTGTTKKIIEEIAWGINHTSVEHIDITKPTQRKRLLETSENDLLVVGVPVYFGRCQVNALEWLQTIKGRNTPVVCIVVYGNREYDDALLELKNTLINCGCSPIALGAYIGEHSFSIAETPIAHGRPDDLDLAHAKSFGKEIGEKIISIPSICRISDISVPGKFPYLDMGDGRKNLSGLDLVSVDSYCVQCGECARVCPVDAIDFENSVSMDSSKCILCHACVKYCPTNARKVKNETVKNVASRLSGALQKRKEPVLFL